MLPPSPAAFVGSHYHTPGVIVNCVEVRRYREYSCKALTIRKHGHACRKLRVHWDGARWIITRNVKGSCPHPLIQMGGSLFSLKV